MRFFHWTSSDTQFVSLHALSIVTVMLILAAGELFYFHVFMTNDVQTNIVNKIYNLIYSKVGQFYDQNQSVIANPSNFANITLASDFFVSTAQAYANQIIKELKEFELNSLMKRKLFLMGFEVTLFGALVWIIWQLSMLAFNL